MMFCTFPVSHPLAMSRDFDRLMKAFFAPRVERVSRPMLERPTAQYRNEQDHYAIDLVIPGVDPEEVHLTLNGNTLTLSNESQAPSKEGVKDEGCGCSSNERHGLRFTHSVQLPEKSDLENIQAEYKHGILTVRIPKAKEKMPLTIPVKVG